MEATLSPEAGRRAALVAVALVAASLSGHVAAHAQSASGRPARIVIQPERRVVKVDSSLKIGVGLVDPFGKPAKAPKVLPIEIEVKPPSKRTEKKTVSIQAGRESQDLQLRFNEVGLVQLIARNPELREGSAFIQVRQTLSTALNESAPVVPRLVSAFIQPPSSPSASPELLHLALDVVVDRTSVLANGQDEAKINAFLNDYAPLPIAVDLIPSRGQLRPRRLQIPAGELFAEAALTCDTPGPVTLTFVATMPRVTPPAKKVNEVTFNRPVEKVVVGASWPAISLFESINLPVKLLGANDQPVVTDTTSIVQFKFGSGRGQIKPADLTFEPYKHEKAVTFIPTWGGSVKVSAETLNVPPGNIASFDVVWPWGTFVLTMIGAALCVLLRARRGGTASVPLSAAAAAFGFVLCWALVFSLVTIIPPRWLLNPVSPLLLTYLMAWGAYGIAERPALPLGRSRVSKSGSVMPPPVEPTGVGAHEESLTTSSAPRFAHRPVKIFFSYAREDEKLLDQLAAHMSLMERNGLITLWHDRRIGPGEQWNRQINEHLKSADIILLLISADFLASDYANDIEVTLALKRHRAGEAKVIPVILRDADWRQPPLDELQALPIDGKPVTSHANADEALRLVAERIRAVVTMMQHVAER